MIAFFFCFVKCSVSTRSPACLNHKITFNNMRDIIFLKNQPVHSLCHLHNPDGCHSACHYASHEAPQSMNI